MASIGIHGAGAGGGGTPSDPSEVNVIEWGSVATSLGQKAMAASVPVVLASDQTAVQVDVTDKPARDLGKVDVASLDQYTPISGRLPVDGSGVTQPVSAVSLPLPTGASTAALQTQPGVDIGDVTVNNGAGASAVNIQDGGNSITIDGSLTVTGTTTTKEIRSATGTTTSVSDTASNVTLLASNASRLGATVYNDSTVNLFVKLGATASLTSFTVRLTPNAYYEVPYNYTGIIDGIWASDASGSARITELT